MPYLAIGWLFVVNFFLFKKKGYGAKFGRPWPDLTVYDKEGRVRFVFLFFFVFYNHQIGVFLVIKQLGLKLCGGNYSFP